MLCLTLGNGRWTHPAHMLADMTAREFDDWAALYEIDPWGEARADLRMQRQVCATLQPHSKRRLDERSYAFKFRTSRQSAGNHKQRAMQRYGLIRAHMLQGKAEPT